MAHERRQGDSNSPYQPDDEHFSDLSSTLHSPFTPGSEAHLLGPGTSPSPSPQQFPGVAKPFHFRSASYPSRASRPVSEVSRASRHSRQASDVSSIRSDETEARIGSRAGDYANRRPPTSHSAWGGGGEGFELQPVRTKEQRKVWSSKVDWYVPSAMIATFVLGVVGAVGHHVYYKSLDGKPAVDQLLKVRFGTALAFFTKASLVGSVVLAYRQRLWHTLRQKVVTIRGIDALFAVVEDPSWFVMSREILAKAKLATTMALITWLIPIASVFSPGSLTAQLAPRHFSTECRVPSLNFTNEADVDWRHPTHYPGYNMMFFNTTPPPPAKSEVDWYDQPSSVLTRLVYYTVYGMMAKQPTYTSGDNPCSGYNCTYAIEFEGPHYNCSETTFEEAAPYMNETDFVPNSPPIADGGVNYVYYGYSDDGYARPQAHYNSNTYTDQGVFDVEPKLWLGYVVNTTKREDDNPRWNYTMEPRVVQCVHQKATYRVETDFTNDKIERTITVKDGQDLLSDGATMSPKPAAGSHLSQPVQPEYKVFAAYHALGSLVRSTFLNGSLVQDNQTQAVITQSRISQTVLADPTSAYPTRDLPRDLERFYHQVVVSLLSEPNLEIAQEDRVPCNKTRNENVFVYHAQSLWIGYAVAIFVAFASICIGLDAIRWNGFTTDTTFSKILVTTRNSALDRMVKSYEGVSLGGDPFPRELQTLGLRFGVVDDDGLNADRKVKHTAFGTEAATTRIRRHDVRYQLLDQEAADRDSSPPPPAGSRGPWFPAAGLGAVPRM